MCLPLAIDRPGDVLASGTLRTEFYAVGLRNPWRISFDPVTGWLWCGDVGGGAREEVDIKFLSSKRWTLIKGDSLLHIAADPLKAEGTRIRITEIEADQYFPIYDPADGERVERPPRADPAAIA